MSASRMPVCRPRRCKVTASRPVTRDLPTPPLPLTTPITFLIWLWAWGASCMSLDSQFCEQLLQSWLQFSLMVLLHLLNALVADSLPLANAYHTLSTRRAGSVKHPMGRRGAF